MLKNLFFNLSKFANDADKSKDPQDIGKDDITPKPKEQKPADVAPKKSFTIVNIDSEIDKSFIALNFTDPLTKKTTLSSQEFRDLNNIADSFIEENKTGTRYPIWGQINNKKSVDKILRRSGTHTLLINRKLSKFVERVAKKLENYGYDIEPLSPIISQGKQQQQQAAEAPVVTYKLELLKNFRNNVLNSADRRLFFGIRISKPDDTIVPREIKENLTTAIRSSGLDLSQNMEPGTASYVPDEGAYILNKCSPEKLSAIATDLKNSKIDVSEFEQKISEYAPYYTQVENQAVDARKVIQAEDASEDTKFLLSIDYPEYYDLKEELKYYVTCAFPTYGSHEHDMNRQPRVGPDGAPMDSMEPEGMRVAHDTNQKWYLYGSFDDFYQFGSMLKNLGWDVTQYISKIENLMQKNVLNIRMFNDKQRFTGALDGYEKTRKVKLPDGTEKELQLRNEDGTLAYDKDKFDSNIDNSVQEDIKLYDKQKDGIRWLYSRESAILGDDTGTGKTLTSAVTALMRSRPEGKILIVTKKELIFQWAREINTKLMTPADKICICLPKLKTGYEGLDYTFDDKASPESIANAKWVLVSYPSIAAEIQRKADGQFVVDAQGNIKTTKRPKAEKIINSLRNTNFDVAILDEAHVVKNPDSRTSISLSTFLPKIPFKYAATATPIANTPEDVHNLLNLVGHTLGKLTSKQFKDSFVGQKLTLRSFDIRSADDEYRRKVLAKNSEKADRLNRVLALSGVYLARTKPDIREDMPTHHREIAEHNEADIDIQKLADELEKARQQVVGGFVLAQLTAQRKLLAKHKAPLTIAEAKRILDESPANKVLIFSNFIEAINIMASELDAHIKATDPLYDAEEEERLSNFINFQRVLTIKEDMEGTSVQRAVDTFKDIESRSRVMIISARKGGTGISLENCTQHVIVNDYDWAPVTFKQTEGRAFRINSIDDVFTKYIVLRTEQNSITLDGVMFEYVSNKIAIAERTQEVTSEIQNLILNGAVAAPQYGQLQAEINNLQLQDMDTDSKVRQELIARGIIGENDNLDDIVEQLDEYEEGEDRIV